ncbi:MAG: ATP-binding protein [Planctomycetota bacterium]
MDEVARLRAQIEALELEVARLRSAAGERARATPAQQLWSKRDLVWNQLERTLRLGTWTWDVNTQQVSWSPNLFEVLGYDPARTPVAEAAKVFDEAIHPEDLEAYLEAQERALGGDTSRPARFRFIRPDGRTIHVLLLYTAVQDEAGAPLSFAGAVLDVTEQVQAEHERLRAGRLEVVGRLAGSVAHDFNNLLAVIMGNVEVLLRERPESEGLKDIRLAVEAASSLTYQLLSFTRQRFEAASVFALDALVSDAGPLLERLLREDTPVRLELGAEGVLVSVDPGLFQGAVLNLAANARDAMPTGGQLVLRTRPGHFPAGEGEPPREAAVLQVEDAGVGMDEATLARAFEPFFTTKDQPQGPIGTGLGLVSVRSFVRGAGGDLRVRSAPGAGTTFELFFPRAAPPEGGARAAGAAPAPRLDLRGDEIVVVEDTGDVRRVLLAGLRRAGLEGAHSFASAEEALARWPALRGRARVLITDVVMPGRSGRELAALLRRDDPALGVVFVTGYDPAGTPLEGSVVLGKPYTLAQLLDALRAVTPPRRARP